MTILEVIQLIKNNAPADLTLEQAEAVRAKLQESPQLLTLLGERESVEEYLAALPTAEDVPTVEAKEDRKNVDPVTMEPDPSAPDVTAAVRGRRWQVLAAGLVLTLGGAYWIYSAQNRAHENVVVDADGKLDSSTEITDDIDESVGKMDHPVDSIDATPSATAAVTSPSNKERLWNGWTYTGDEGAEHNIVAEWDLSQPENLTSTMSLVTGRRPVVLSQEHELAASERWLRMRFRHLARSAQPGTVEVRADGRPIAEFDFPMFGERAEYAVPLAGIQGRAKFEVIVRPGDEHERISWWTIRFADSAQSPDGDIVVVPRLPDATASVAAASVAPETETARGPENVVQLIPSPYAMFEDDGEFTAADKSATGSATLVTEQAYSGAAAIRVTPGGPFRRELPQKIVISEQPGPGEFRYLRFAVRVHGGGRTALVLDHTAAAEMPVSYDLGEGDSAFAKAYRIHVVPADDGWVVVTRDLFRDYGRIEMTGLMLSKLDGGHALFDHVYLARSRSQFDRAPQPADPSLAKHVTPPEPVGPASANLAQTVVAIRLDHRLATGVIVSEDGFVFTTAEIVIQGAKEIVVYLWDGSSAPAEIIATRRDFNVGLLKISDQGRYYPYAKMAEASNVGARRTYRAFSHYYSFKPGKAPEEIVVPSTTPFFGYAKVGSVQDQFAVGGPVFDPEGQVIGIHIGSERGAMRYREIEYFTMYWDQLAAGESGG